MKRFAYLAVAFFTLFLVSYAAATLDVKNIGNSRFTLLSNTDSCLVDCEAWIEWDLSAESFNRTVSLQNDSQFGFDVAKRSAKSPGLQDFGVDVFKERSFQVNDYCIELEYFTFGFGDLNQSSCLSIGCVDGKVAGECSCSRNVRKVCGSHVESRWEKVGNFYGFKALKGETYRLRVWGKKKAVLGENSVDWIPTFLGEEISEWDWWDTNWRAKKNILLKTSSWLSGNVTTDHVVLVDFNSEQTNFWLTVDPSGKDIRFVDGTDSALLEFYLERWDYSDQNMIAWVRVTDTFDASANINFNIYYGNVAASPLADSNATFTPDYNTVWDMNESSSSAIANNRATGGNALLHGAGTRPGVVGKHANATSYLASLSSSSTFMSTGTYDEFSFSLWAQRPNVWDDTKNATQLFFEKDLAASNYIALGWRDYDASDQLGIMFRTTEGVNGTANAVTSKQTFDANVWYHVIATYSNSNNRMKIYVNGSTVDGNVLNQPRGTIDGGSISEFNVGATGGVLDGVVDTLKFFTKELSDDEALLIYNSERGALQTYGVQETFSGIDVNVLAPNGGEVFIVSQTVDINFEVQSDVDNTLLIDINYFKSGETVEIIDDVNTDSSEVFCDTNNFSVSDICHYSWTVPAIFGDWKVIVKIADSVFSQYDDSDATFEVETIDLNADFSFARSQVVSGSKVVVQIAGSDASDVNNVSTSSFEWYRNNVLQSSDQNANVLLPYAGSWEVTYRVFGSDVFGNDITDDSNITFAVEEGRLQLMFKDENTHGSIDPGTLTVNGSADSTSSGLLHLDLNNISTADYTIRAETSGTYTTREWFWKDVNQFSVIDLNVTLLQDIYGQTDKFMFYDPPGTTILPNTIIELRLPDVNVSERRQTDSAGKVSFFVNNQDVNYFFRIYDNNYEVYDYNMVIVKFEIPKDEDDLSAVSPFDLDVRGTGSVSFSGKTAPVFFHALPNTLSYYQLDLNGGNTYLTRKREINYKGAPQTDVIQMYLPKAVDGITAAFYTLDTSDLSTVPNILIKSFKSITGEGRVEVQSVATDDSGTASLSFLVDNDYDFDFYDSDGGFLFTKSLKINFTGYYVYLDTTEITQRAPPWEYVAIQVVPSKGYLEYSSTGGDVNVSIDTNGTIVSSWAYIRYSNVFDSNIDANQSCGTTCGFTIPYASLIDETPIVVTVFVETENGLIRESSYSLYVFGAGSNDLVIQLSSAAFRSQFGCMNEPGEPCFFLLMLSSFIIIATVVAIGVGLTTDMSAIGIIVMIEMAMFTYLNWVPPILTALAGLAVFAAILYRRGAG